MEKSLVCMREWKEVSSTSGAEIQRLKDELGAVKQERDALMAVARDAGKTLIVLLVFYTGSICSAYSSVQNEKQKIPLIFIPAQTRTSCNVFILEVENLRYTLELLGQLQLHNGSFQIKL